MSHFDDEEERLTDVPGRLYHPRPGRPYSDFDPVTEPTRPEDHFLTYGEAPEVQRTYTCQACGAAVTDTDLHNDWHQKENR